MPAGFMTFDNQGIHPQGDESPGNVDGRSEADEPAALSLYPGNRLPRRQASGEYYKGEFDFQGIFQVLFEIGGYGDQVQAKGLSVSRKVFSTSVFK